MAVTKSAGEHKDSSLIWKKDTTFHMSLYVHVFVTITALKPYST